MSVLSLLMISGVTAVPAVALWSLYWASRHGEFQHPERTALLPFDEQEPMGEPTDLILNRSSAKK